MIRKLAVLTLIAAFAVATGPSLACTGVSLKAKDGAAVRGRTLEFGDLAFQGADLALGDLDAVPSGHLSRFVTLVPGSVQRELPGHCGLLNGIAQERGQERPVHWLRLERDTRLNDRDEPGPT